jgi:hypothetical protein
MCKKSSETKGNDHLKKCAITNLDCTLDILWKEKRIPKPSVKKKETI